MHDQTYFIPTLPAWKNVTISITNVSREYFCKFILLILGSFSLFQFTTEQMAHHNELGMLGEDIAAAYLLRKGYKIHRRNFIYDKAEIDIIAEKDGMIVVVEVKTRNSSFFGDPQSFVSKGKIKLLVKAANEYMISNNLEQEVRFDIVAILKNKYIEQLEHFENAFYHF